MTPMQGQLLWPAAMMIKATDLSKAPTQSFVEGISRMESIVIYTNTAGHTLSTRIIMDLAGLGQCNYHRRQGLENVGIAILSTSKRESPYSL
jgi:hypothetical protein